MNGQIVLSSVNVKTDLDISGCLSFCPRPVLSEAIVVASLFQNGSRLLSACFGQVYMGIFRK